MCKLWSSVIWREVLQYVRSSGGKPSGEGDPQSTLSALDRVWALLAGTYCRHVPTVRPSDRRYHLCRPGIVLPAHDYRLEQAQRLGDRSAQLAVGLDGYRLDRCPGVGLDYGRNMRGHPPAV